MLDLLLRGGAIGTICLTGAILLSDPRSQRYGAPVAVFGVLISCYLAVSSPAATDMPQAARQGLEFGATLVPVAFTWMILELLTGPQIRRWPWLLLAATTVISFAVPVWPMAGPLRDGLMILLYLGLMGLAVMSDRDDLVASRRQFRRGFLAAMTLLGVVISLVEATGADADLPAYIYPLQAATFWGLGLLFAWQTLRPGDDLIQEPAKRDPPRTPARSDLIIRLEGAMTQGAWRREGLSIRALADELAVPEHRLRSAINRELGYRNFSTFINGHRIDAAKSALADPEKAQVTILEIAYDSGFASLGPFNKAFRAQTGQSPREYRANPG